MNALVYGTPRLQFDVVTSTNDLARVWAQRGIGAGALVTAGSQTRGRGRRGHGWIDEPGQSAIMTFIGAPGTAIESAWRVPFAASLAAWRTVSAFGVEDARTKWPNDVLAGDRKITGVLVEMVPIGDAGATPLIGIGINVGQREFADCGNFVWPPASLYQATGGRNIPPETVIARVASELSATMALLDTWAGWASLMDEWGGAMLTGITQSGRTKDGVLATGTLRRVRAEDGAGLIEVAGGETVAIWPDDGAI
ncbi:MAG: biotin--[acetyl-CoA-carboxylase] ligase [Capsulimonadaceae bacterium]|nr:biotin--[acetyl-CoA-carboxylase] ligase [Capsulimonadaceae bacterium]